MFKTYPAKAGNVYCNVVTSRSKLMRPKVNVTKTIK